jgi:AcrR family transcriptional regulator
MIVFFIRIPWLRNQHNEGSFSFVFALRKLRQPAPKPSTERRKTAVQQRSRNTVDAILEATIQVLLRDGMVKLTTVRIAERAGVSVGTLYQYYPNKQALLADVLRRHITTITTRVEAACRAAHGSSLREIATTLVGSFLAAKLERTDLSLALYAIPDDALRNSVAQDAIQRFQSVIREVLESCPKVCFRNPALAGFMATTALIGPVQTWLQSGGGQCTVAELESSLCDLIEGYLRSASA